VPNALLPTFTIVLLSLGFVFGGVIAIEYVFSYPGLGLLEVRAINSKDFPLLQGLFLLFSAAVIVTNLVADILYSYLDPRVRAAGCATHVGSPFELDGDERLDVPLGAGPHRPHRPHRPFGLSPLSVPTSKDVGAHPPGTAYSIPHWDYGGGGGP
jgi:Binding-protein-dependent transport system inner membrane component